MALHGKKGTLFALLFLISGLALVISVLTKLSLTANLSILTALAIIIAYSLLRDATTAQRKNLRQHIRNCILISIVATAAYDLSRFILVTAFSLNVWPFEALPHFGTLLLGPNASQASILTAGIVYHIVNGITFGIAYGLLFKAPNWKNGLCWGIALEVAMVAIYPGWLSIRALDEFVSMSLVGHAFYGLTLGIGLKRYGKRIC